MKLKEIDLEGTDIISAIPNTDNGINSGKRKNQLLVWRDFYK